MRQKILELFYKYERQISSGALVLGFIIDNLTLRRVDLLAENILLIAYITIAFGGILIMQVKPYPFIPTIVQFVFGGLFSAFFVFYTRSGSFATSWPFILMLGTLLIGNEFLRKQYARLTFQLSVLYVIIFSYLIFVVPIILRRIDVLSFLISGLFSLLIMAVLIQILLRISGSKVREERNKIRLYIISIFVFINLLYFTNSIPPIPLSLSDIGIYHEVRRTVSGYEVLDEERNWFSRFFSKTIHINPGESLYAYSSVFAPTKINTDIVHEWWHKGVSGKWQKRSTIKFPIFGGRDGGYRGYSISENIFPGKWRVDVKNTRGQLIGRSSFTVEYARGELELERIIK